MPSLCKKRGVTRWRGNVMVSGVAKVKWFPDASRASQRAAVLWEEETRRALAEMIREGAEAETTGGDCSVIEWANACLDRYSRTVAPKTFEEKHAEIGRFVRHFGAQTPLVAVVTGPGGDVDLGRLLAFFDEQCDTRSGNAANKARKNLRKAWKDGKKLVAGFPAIYFNPFDEMDRYPETRRPRYVPSAQDFWKVMDVVDGQDRVLLLTFLHLAARKREVFYTDEEKPGLTWDDVDFVQGLVQLWTRKRRGGDLECDHLPMTKELRAALLWWWEARPREYRKNKTVFFCVNIGDAEAHGRLGKPFMHRYKFMSQACKRAGVKPFGLHAIRHFTARHLHDSGYQVSFIQRILRHESEATTRKYLAKLGVGTIRKTVEDGMPRMGNVLDFPEPKSALGGQSKG